MQIFRSFCYVHCLSEVENGKANNLKSAPFSICFGGHFLALLSSAKARRY